MTPAAIKIRLEDRLRYCPHLRGLLARIFLAQGRFMAGTSPQATARAIACLCRGARLAPTPELLSRIEQALTGRIRQFGDGKLDWSKFVPQASRRRLEKAVLLKPRVSDTERGVIFISFENQWARLLSLPNLEAFARDYTLVLAPSWSPPHSVVNCLFPVCYPASVFIQTSHRRDLEIFPRLSPRYRPIPLLASHWVNPEWFAPRPVGNRDIAILMVANFGKFKRHHALFRALQQLPASLRVVLIGQHEGKRTAASLMAEAAAFGVAHRFELRESVPHQQVCETLSQAHISLILSRREGSCVVVAESLFANTPVGLLEGAEIGSAQFITPQTGRFLAEENLAGQLQEFLAHAHEYQPRQWAMQQGISCHGSSALLNVEVKSAALAERQTWTVDLAPMQWRPDPQLIHAPDQARLRAGAEELHRRYGLELGAIKPGQD
jgi:glycosyltransferase involved in cell wall biosynthesis